METIEEAPEPHSYLRSPDTTSNWGVAHGLLTVSVLLTLLVVAWLGYVMHGKPIAPKDRVDDAYIEKRVDDMTLLQTFQMWSTLRYDIRVKHAVDYEYLAAMKAYNIRFWVAVILLAAGVFATLLTLAFARKEKK